MAASFRPHDYSAPVPPEIQALVDPHIQSFDYFVQRGMEESFRLLLPAEINVPAEKQRFRMWIERPQLFRPHGDGRKPIFPSECREAGRSYKGELRADLVVEDEKGPVHRLHTSFGRLPIMVKSSLCHLRHLSQKDLIRVKEEALEMGGYFICNGNERIMRMLIAPKRNYVMAIKRSAFMRKGAGFSDMATAIRCGRLDQSTVTNRCIYLEDGSVVFNFTHRKNEFYIPVALLLKALVEVSDFEIFEQLVASAVPEGQAIGTDLNAERGLIILEQLHKSNLFTRAQCVAYLGQRFRGVLQMPESKSDSLVGDVMLRELVLVHLDAFPDKFTLLMFMIHKLFALVDGTAQADSADTLNHQDVVTAGDLLTIFVKERMEMWLAKVARAAETEKRGTDLYEQGVMKKIVDRNPLDIGQAVEYMLNTGNLSSPSGLDLQQAAGFTVVAEKLNFLRYLSHFRSVHRGAYFAQLQTTAVRKLLPESWGFLCPVHTPDGAPCGLLNHLTSRCRITTDLHPNLRKKERQDILRLLLQTLTPLGLQPIGAGLPPPPLPANLSVLLDGCILGHMKAEGVGRAVGVLRSLKVDPLSGLPEDMEVGHVPPTLMGPFPGLFLFTSPARMVRPVRQLHTAPTAADAPLELVGAFEQVLMEIRCPDGEQGAGEVGFTHEEIEPTSMLSVVASLTPWSDFNQSPRNMYQCQMGKQTMGVPTQTPFRMDNKLYRLQTPQTPIARTEAYRRYGMDNFPTGTNAVVAVMSYTGYDMEDAMIINKSAMERGFAHGQIYKVETVDLTTETRKGSAPSHRFGRLAGKGPQAASLARRIDVDGLPHVGQTIRGGDAFVSTVNAVNGQATLKSLKGSEDAVVDGVTLIGGGSKEPLQKVAVRLRFPRNPQIGDKFSSRHGQKGVLSQLWPDADMPFAAETGMRPDIIINPHAFPSRMTIGMLIESLASKGGALHGRFVNATPFRSSTASPSPLFWPSDGPGVRGEEAEGGGGGEGGGSENLVEEFGRQLVSKGFSHYGTEVIYSGLLGTEMKCEIYMGLVYYQRLRHMVSDKFQVRSTGAVNPLTQQPVKGRKFGGGIRFGEMERDALLSHGAAYLLHDRLHTCSDYHTADVCGHCGSLLAAAVRAGGGAECRVCGTGEAMERVAMPYVFKYLAAELAAMNLKLTLHLEEDG